MLLRVKVVTSDFKKFYVTISCHDKQGCPRAPYKEKSKFAISE